MKHMHWFFIAAAALAATMSLVACDGGEKTDKTTPGAAVTEPAAEAEDESEGEEWEEGAIYSLEDLDSYRFTSSGKFESGDIVDTCKVEITTTFTPEHLKSMEITVEELIESPATGELIQKNELRCIAIDERNWILEDGEWTEGEPWECDNRADELIWGSPCWGPENIEEELSLEYLSSLKGESETVDGIKAVRYSFSKADLERIWPEAEVSEEWFEVKDARMDLWVAAGLQYPVQGRVESTLEDKESGGPLSFGFEFQVSNINDESLKVEAP